jgi:hypothetical protein
VAQHYVCPAQVGCVPPGVVCPASGRVVRVGLASPEVLVGRIPLATYGPDFKFCSRAGMYVCNRCDFAHGTASSFAVHLLQKHGARRLSSRYARDGYCPICLSCFPSREKNILHFSGRGSRGFSVCLLNLIVSQDPMCDDEVDALNASDRADARANRARCRTVAFCEAPCLVAYGPARPIVVCPGMTRRSTSLSLGAALKRAILIPVDVHPIATGVLGDSMQLHAAEVCALASAALRAQRFSDEA